MRPHPRHASQYHALSQMAPSRPVFPRAGGSRHRLGFAITFCLASAAPAHGQEMNYTALQEMFGEPVTTSATGAPLRASDAPADMQIITADDIRRSGVSDIPDLLRFVAGVDVQTYGALDSAVSIRGYSQPFNPSVLVMVNGRQIFQDDYGYTNWSALPVRLADIQQIEVVRGPAAALFGFDAASGVINIITKNPLYEATNSVTVGAGTGGAYQGALVTTFNDPGKAGITLQAGGLTRQQYPLGVLPASLGPYYGKAQQTSVSADARAQPIPGVVLGLAVSHASSDSLQVGPQYFYFQVPARDDSIEFSLAAQTPAGLIKLLAYLNDNVTILATGFGVRERSGSQSGVVQLSDLLTPGPGQTLRGVFEFRDNQATGQIVSGALGYNDLAGSLMWHVQLTPSLALTAAGRLDATALDRSDPLPPGSPYGLDSFTGQRRLAASYNAGLVWQASPLDTLRLLAGRAVQVPSLISAGTALSEQDSPVNVYYAGDPTLKAAITTSEELDYTRSLPALAADWRSALFFSTTRDLDAAGFMLPGTLQNGEFLFQSSNIGSGQTAGLEQQLSGQLGMAWRWSLAYTLTGVRTKLDAAPPTSAVDWQNGSPVSALDAMLGFTAGPWQAQTQAHWQSRYSSVLYEPTDQGDNFPPQTIAPYVTLSARLAYALSPRLTLAVTGSQLQGAQTTETAGLKPERQVLFIATSQF